MCADESERQRTSLGAELRKLTRYARERGPRGKLGVKGSSSSRRDGTLACRVRDDLGRHAKAGEEWQPRNQKPAADSEAGKVHRFAWLGTRCGHRPPGGWQHLQSTRRRRRSCGVRRDPHFPPALGYGLIGGAWGPYLTGASPREHVGPRPDTTAPQPASTRTPSFPKSWLRRRRKLGLAVAWLVERSRDSPGPTRIRLRRLRERRPRRVAWAPRRSGNTARANLGVPD